jgi:hypothetical protein
MTTRKEIARAAAKAAALATYKTFMSGSLVKGASSGQGYRTKDLAKSAAAATYNAITRLAQAPAPAALAPARTLTRVLDGLGMGTLGDLLRGEQVNLDTVEAEWAQAKMNPELTAEEKAQIMRAARNAGANVA